MIDSIVEGYGDVFMKFCDNIYVVRFWRLLKLNGDGIYLLEM